MNCVNINRAFICGDRFCDYLPVISGVTNLFAIFAKCLLNFYSTKAIESNRCFSHIKNKKEWRCIVLLVPILGNIVIGIYDIVKSIQSKRKCLELALEARFLGLDIKQLPKKASEIEKLIEAKCQEKLKQMELVLEQQVVSLNLAVDKFKKIIENPEEPLRLINQIGAEFEFNGPHRVKIEQYWSNLRVLFSTQNLVLAGLDENEHREHRQQISKLRDELLNLRESSYKQLISTIDEDELLQEARKYYLRNLSIELDFKNLSKEEQDRIKNKVSVMDKDKLQRKLHDMVDNSDQEGYDLVEIRAIDAILI